MPITIKTMPMILITSSRPSGPAQQVAHQCDQEQNQKKIKQDLGDAGSSHRNSGKAQQRGDQRDDKKSQCPAQHVLPPLRPLRLDGYAQSRNRAVEWTLVTRGGHDSLISFTKNENAFHTA